VKTTVRMVLSLLVAGLLLTALMIWGEVSPADAFERLSNLPPQAYALALAVHVGIYLLRAWRFRVLIPRAVRPTYTRALISSSAHNLASYVLPAKTGEASFIVYMRTHAAVPASSGLASLVVARILDLTVLCGLMGVTCLVLSTADRYSNLWWLDGFGLVLCASTVLFGLLSWRVDLLVRLMGAVARGLKFERIDLGRRILERMGSVAEALRIAGGSGKLVYAAVLTVPVWLGVFAFYAVLVVPMGLPESIGFPEATFGSSLAMVANLLPVNGMAGFGTQEAGWVVGFSTLGVERELALATGVGVHFIQLFNVVAMGLLAHLAMGAMPAAARS